MPEGAPGRGHRLLGCNMLAREMFRKGGWWTAADGRTMAAQGAAARRKDRALAFGGCCSFLGFGTSRPFVPRQHTQCAANRGTRYAKTTIPTQIPWRFSMQPASVVVWRWLMAVAGGLDKTKTKTKTRCSREQGRNKLRVAACSAVGPTPSPKPHRSMGRAATKGFRKPLNGQFRCVPPWRCQPRQRDR